MLKQIVLLEPRLSVYQGLYVSSEKLILARLDYLIELHFKTGKSPDFYSGSLGYTARALNKVTKFFRDRTVFELIQDRLMVEARLLLSRSRLSVKLIAYKIGFEDPAYFCRFFKKMTGMTPQQYRKNQVYAK